MKETFENIMAGHLTEKQLELTDNPLAELKASGLTKHERHRYQQQV
ncbi:hypothetical protein ACFLTZ_04510 [Chloroflexota bacterium]